MISSENLQIILDSYKIPAIVVNEIVGSRITTYEVKLIMGAKTNSLTRVANDIALNMGVENVIIKPIPENQTYGIEVPNKEVKIVNIKDIFASDQFRYAKSKLTFGLGKDINGNVVVGDIKEMPHLLVAGATGAGKSVFVNALITSLLFKASPKDLKMLLIDPKMIELSGYDGIPHLLSPVITDAKKAVKILDYMVEEMERRYKVFELNAKHFKLTMKNIEDYNNAVMPEYKMPHIVIIIDELADLMMESEKAIEEPIIRLAQKARAAGIHLIIATQRPDRNIITGLIKANIPSKIAFAVSSGINSRIILDESGAEKLLGKGDMLYSPVGAMKSTRIQGVYISNDEIDKILNFIKDNNSPPIFDEDILNILDEKNESMNHVVGLFNTIFENCGNGQKFKEFLLKESGYIINIKS